ncbi:MAG TPA: ATP synthase F0 subunit B [Deltaproteobacteria bacterium]|nr:ATP synthase F0 subunit B [Deltaproteobacteria bacterium]
MIKIDGSVVIQIVNFVFLIWILNIVLFKPIRRVLHQRKEKIAGLEKNIATCIRDVNEKDDSISSELRSAKQKGVKELENLLQSADEEEKKLIKSINEKAVVEMDAIRVKIANDAENVRKTLQKEIDTFASEIGRKILGRAV